MTNDIAKRLQAPNSKGMVIEVIFDGNSVDNNINYKNLTPYEIIGYLETLKQKMIEIQMKTTKNNNKDDFLNKLR